MVLSATGFEPAPPDSRSGAHHWASRTASYRVFVLGLTGFGPKGGDKLIAVHTKTHISNLMVKNYIQSCLISFCTLVLNCLQ